MIKRLPRRIGRIAIIPVVVLLQFSCHFLYAQESKISGKVLAENGTALPGVNVIIKGTSIGTTTDADGLFALNAPNQSAVLVFSFIGYKTTEVPVGSQSSFEIKLLPDVETLTEVVVVGYGETKKESLTSAITSVKGKELVKSPQPNLSNSFAGRVSGVVASTATGEPGSDNARLLIRGQSTTGDNSPLVVIDGVANRLGGLERLDPNDIESISVLKDASAAIYGAQAANGVILITTKRGSTSTGPVFNFTYNQGFAKPTRLPEMADAPTYARILNEIQYYRSSSGGLNQIYSEEEIQKFSNGSDPINYPNTDWIDAVMKSVSLQDQQNLSIAGGGSDVQYFVSLGRRHQDGIYKNTNLEFEQFNIRSNIDVNLTKNLRMGIDLSGRIEDRVFPTESAGSIFRSTFRTYPVLPVYYPGGLPAPGIEAGLNPVVIATSKAGSDKQPKTVLNSLLTLDYKLPFAPGLSVKGFYAHDRIFDARKLFRTPWTVYTLNSSTNPVTFDPVQRGPVTAELTQRERNDRLSTANISLNYEKSIGSNFIKAFVAYEQNVQEADWFETFRRGYLSPLIPEIDLGGSAPEERTNSGNSERFTRRNYFGRISFDHNQRYLAEVQFRYDGSSKFMKGNQYGFFPSASVGWRISEESWFDVSAIGNLKLRASYGLLGNDRIRAFQYLNTFNLRSSNYVLDGTPVPTFGILQLANPDITWETARKLDIGVETTLFGKLTLELDYFSERRTDLLIPRTGSIPYVSGIVNEYQSGNPLTPSPIIPDENIGEVKNSGVEAQLGYNHDIGDVHLTLGGNITYNKSEVVYMDDSDGIPSYQRREGRPLGAQLFYKTMGIFKTVEDLNGYPHVPGAGPGDLIYEDVNKSGSITADDRVMQSLSNVPQIVYGFTAAASFRNFDLTILLQGQARSVQYVLTEAGEVGNFFNSWASNRWSPSNPNGTYPRVDVRTSSSINGALYKNDFWLYNTSFMRIKNVELGYNFSTAAFERLRLKGARLYVNAFNLATFSKVKDFDPEGQSESGQFYPQQQIYNVGVNLKF
ncbi:TonB-dependent receptor [Fulvivirgaceae bacterium PWU4]|uniref:TonB-dependent receptor n=1 Tax=Chryseosolibacter histidini TaxID=2782349 RepID=A0AAP2DJE1_9BACT|nr:TonB-dependent receptor [Chryseosolibacter histidini]MBT1697320.1 TonB-dependent receptor [Chryseosolibacter histidini]